MANDSRLLGVTVPLVVGMNLVAPLPAATGAAPAAADSTVTVRAGTNKSIEVSVKTYPAQLKTPSVIPLTVSSFIPRVVHPNVTEEDFLDVDFGEPDPFVVPPSWVDQFSNVDPARGLSGSIHEHEAE